MVFFYCVFSLLYITNYIYTVKCMGVTFAQLLYCIIFINLIIVVIISVIISFISFSLHSFKSIDAPRSYFVQHSNLLLA